MSDRPLKGQAMAGTYPDSQVPRARSARGQFWLDHLRAWQAQGTSLRAYAADRLSMDPFSAQLFVFTHRRRTQCRILDWERCGFVLWHKRLERIGEVVSERLDIVPAKVRVLRHIRGKYRCPSCEGHLRTAALPAQPLPKRFASPGLLAFIVTAKYVDGWPLYRQQQQFASTVGTGGSPMPWPAPGRAPGCTRSFSARRRTDSNPTRTCDGCSPNCPRPSRSATSKRCCRPGSPPPT